MRRWCAASFLCTNDVVLHTSASAVALPSALAGAPESIVSAPAVSPGGMRRGRSSALLPGSSILPTTGPGSMWKVGGRGAGYEAERVKTELQQRTSILDAERRVLPLTRAWDAAQHLLKPAADHVRLAWLRELQAAATPHRADVPPPLRSTTPLEYQVVDLDHFLLSAAVFYDFSTQLSAHTGGGGAGAGGGSFNNRQPGAQSSKGKGGSLVDFPLAASLLAVLRRSVLSTES